MLLHWACGGRASSCNGGPAVENHYPLTNTGAERGWGVTGKEFTRERGYFQGGLGRDRGQVESEGGEASVTFWSEPWDGMHLTV